MFAADTFDVILQFNQQVMKDIQVRALNASLNTNLWTKGPLSRIIEQHVPLLEVKACWNKPNIEICDGDKNDLAQLSVEVNGGARQTMTGRILTIDGEVSTKLPAVLNTDPGGLPYARLETPNLLRLHMKNLKVSYEGSKWPEFLAKIDPAKAETSLRLILATQLIGRLASIPLTYIPHSLPVAMPGAASDEALLITQAQAKVLRSPNSVVLGLMFDQNRNAPSTFSTLLPDQTKYNAALGISAEGLNTLLSHLCKQKRATGNLIHSKWGPINWQWENLAIILHQGIIQIAGILWQSETGTVVHAQVQCFLDKDGCLQSHLISTNTDMETAETILASWSTLLKALLRSRASEKQDYDQQDQERLYQCFNLPGTSEIIETLAQELVVQDGMLTVYYTIPETLQGFQAEVPPARPTIIISQPIIPQQTEQNEPVIAQMDATIIGESSPPYDYVWTTDLMSEPRPERGPTLAIRQIPHQTVGSSEPQKLTDVHLKVIDMFGQVAEVQGRAKYLPNSKQAQVTTPLGQLVLLSPRPKKEERLKRSIFMGGCTLAILILLFTISYALANQHVPAKLNSHQTTKMPASRPSSTPVHATPSPAVRPSPTVQPSPTVRPSSIVQPSLIVQPSPFPVKFTLIPPTVLSISPASGLVAGGTPAIITGTGFSSATNVSFGDIFTTDFIINSDTQITAISPPGTGTVHVTVTTSAGASAISSAGQFTYLIPSPRVTGIKPGSGSNRGGTSVAITGTGFSGTTNVSFGGVATTHFTINSSTQITAISPPGAGTVHVTVTTPAGTSVISSAGQFTYIVPPPKVTSIQPGSGSNRGGTSVVITGTGFTSATSVSFGPTAVTKFTINSDTQITIISPPGTGTVHVTVTTPAGTSAISSAGQFTYIVPPPTVTGISPNLGLEAGGTTVTITGTGFTGATGVSFGSTAATNVIINSDTQITVVSPPGSGTVHVTVTTPAGTSTTGTADQFTYQPAS